VDAVIAACGGSERATIRALLIANEYLSVEVERLRASQSVGYVRGLISKVALRDADMR
jgi:hypothetical protein